MTLLKIKQRNKINKMNSKKIGIIGGGQLGKMLIEALQMRKEVEIYVMDPNFDCPCAKIKGVNYYQGDLHDKLALSVFASYCDVLTYEIEHVNCEALIELEEKGKDIRPSPKILKTIQDKFVQKTFFKKRNLPTLPFSKVGNYGELMSIIGNNEKNVVLKSLKGGYDGKGVQVIDRNDREKFDEFIKNTKEALYEEFLEKKTEISVLVSRDLCTNVKTWPVVEMVFDEDNNIMDYMFSPSKLSRETQVRAIHIAKEAIKKLDGVGVFAIEMFVVQNQGINNIYINEIAPRPHNSAHHTINHSTYSVYNSLADILLMDYNTIHPMIKCDDYSQIETEKCALKNIIGNAYGRYSFTCEKGESFEEKTIVYDYSKSVSKPNRKIGHMLVTCEEDEEIVDLLQREYQKLQIDIKQTPKVGVIMGSTSDWPNMQAACDILEELQVDYEKTVVSAHRTPERLYEYAKKTKDRCIGVIIAGAGGAAHLPGMVASMTTVPVIGVPVKTSTLSGVDSLHSIVQMPPGVPVATVAIGGAKNAGILAAQILSLVDSNINSNLESYKQKMKETVTFSANSF